MSKEKELPYYDVRITGMNAEAIAEAFKELEKKLKTNELVDPTEQVTRAVLEEVLEERAKQDIKGGVQSHSLKTWLVILQEEIGKAAKELLNCATTGAGIQRVRMEFIQVAAVAVATIEAIDRISKGLKSWKNDE